MSRTFTTLDLVQLPKLDAASAQTLGTEVLTAAKPFKTLPAPVDEALHDVKHALLALSQTAVRRLPASTGSDPQRTKVADVALDACWSGLFDWLTGWTKIPDLPEAGVASALRDKLYPEGLKFIQLAYKLEWAESNTRLLLIHSEKMEPEIGKLGGDKILARLRKAHAEYGEALGITKALAPEASVGTSIRDALDAFMEALRAYVVQATAMVRKKDPESAKTSAALVAPIAAWEAPGGGGTAKVPVAPEAPPPATPAGTTSGG